MLLLLFIVKSSQGQMQDVCVTPSFARVTTFESGGDQPISITTGDFNGDGKADLAVANQDAANIGILLNNGNGSFATTVTFGSGGDAPGSICSSDFNGDGKADLAVANLGSGNIGVLLNNGTGSFAAAVTYSSGGDAPGSICSSDFNGDGKADLAVANQDSTTNLIGVLLNNGNGSFAAAVTYGSGGDVPGSIATGDFNGDGKADLAAPNQGSANIGVLLNNGSGSFAAAVTFGSGGDSPFAISIDDFNGDKKVDITVTNGNNIGVLLNTCSSIALSVTSFTLVNALTGEDVSELKDGDVIDLSLLPPNALNIRANTTPAEVGSVVFDLQGSQSYNDTANKSPYALFGVDAEGHYLGGSLQVGTNYLTAIPYSAVSGNGTRGTAYAIAFDVNTTAQSYVFVGNGNWNIPENWSNKLIPPSDLPAGTEITIDPVDGGECILNVPQSIPTGVKLTIKAGKKLTVLDSANAQLVNTGGIITVQQGGYIKYMGSFTNSLGTVTNDGKIEVQRDFINTGTYNSTAKEDSLIMSETGNALLRPGGATINFLTINKATDTDFVTLSGSVVVSKKLDYLSGVLSTDYINNSSFAFSAPVSAIFNFVGRREIIGNVERTGWVSGSAVVFNSPQLQIVTNGGISPTDITITMLPQAFGGDPSQTEREVKRKFLFEQTGGSGFTADVHLPYEATELNTNGEANLVPWSLTNGEWNARLTPVTRDTANNWVATTSVNATAFSQEWKLADPRYTFNVTANLRGAWNGTTMAANINSILPKAQPYNVAPFNYSGTESVPTIPNADIVDWVLLELRKPGSGLAQDATVSTIIGRKAGFLLRNGTVVDLDGTTPISFDIAKQGTSFIAVRHRNHLGVLSNAIPSNALGTFGNDFSILANTYKPSGAASDPLVLLSGGIKYGLWAGDANKNGVVNVTDVNAIKLAIAASASGYLSTDVNLSNSINVTDVNVTKTTISASGGGSVSARIAPSGKVRTNLPDPVVE